MYRYFLLLATIITCSLYSMDRPLYKDALEQAIYNAQPERVSAELAEHPELVKEQRIITALNYAATRSQCDDEYCKEEYLEIAQALRAAGCPHVTDALEK